MIEDFLSGENLFRDVVAYCGFGEHRTATEGDLKTTKWIYERLNSCGLKTSYQPFTLPQFFTKENRLEVAGEKIDCFPLWPPRETGPMPVKAPLVVIDAGTKPGSAKGKIAIVGFEHRSRGIHLMVHEHVNYGSTIVPDVQSAISSAIDAGAKAIIAVTRGPAGIITAYNCPDTLKPWPVPILMVGSKDEPVLLKAAKHGAEATFLLDGRMEQKAKASNVIGRSGPGDKNIIIISNPHSGWFRAGGERGTGLSLFLALARWVGQRQPKKVSYLFDSNSGHNRGNVGMRVFMKELMPPPEKVLCWCHIGSSCATWGWEETPEGPRRKATHQKNRVVARTPELLEILKPAFKVMPGVVPELGRGAGEMANNVPMEYPGFGVHGGFNRFLHSPGDGLESTGPELLEPFAVALIRAFESIEKLAK